MDLSVDSENVIPHHTEVTDSYDFDSDIDVEFSSAYKNEMIDLGDGLTVSKKTLLNAANYVHKKIYQFYGEVSFRLPLYKNEIEVISDQYEPLTFLRAAGFERTQAKDILADPIIYSNVYIILKEARLWTQKLNHPQATLLYEAADKLKRGRRAAEYMALVTDAVISGNIPSYDELTGFVRFVDGIEDEQFSWADIIPLSLRKELKNISFMLHQFEVEKVYNDTMELIKSSKEEDEKLLQSLEKSNSEPKSAVDSRSSLSKLSSESESEMSKEKISLTDMSQMDERLLKARVEISEAEMSKQCCIFANYYDPSLYKYVPLVAHMIARGYFTNYIEIEAVVDFLRPVCGMRPVKLVELLDVIENVSNWEYAQYKKVIEQVLVPQ